MSTAQKRISVVSRRERGSVLIIVMWVCIGLVALTLYFANSMSSELRAADNRMNEVSARQAVAAGTRYAAYLLKQYAIDGAVPKPEDYKAEALPVGDATFWFVGRNNDELQPGNAPFFGIVDESSKLNLNTVTAARLQALPLPDMTPEFAAAIVAWRSAGQAGVNADATYATMNPPRHNKSAPFETVDELRLVDGASLDLLLGEDANRNGVLDWNEDDGESSAPRDDQNGRLQAGLLEYVTVYSSLPARAGGARRTNVGVPATQQLRQQVQTVLTNRGIPAQRATQIVQRIPVPQGPGQGQGQQQPAFNSVADFMLATQMTAEEFALVHTSFSVATANSGVVTGLVNVNTASEAVLAALPGIGVDRAASVVAFRQAHPDELTSFHWLTQVLTPGQLRQAGPFITDHSYQFSVDIAAVGSNGRGYCREKVVFDMSTGGPRIVYRQDLSSYGWALGAQARRTLTARRDI